MMTLVGCSEKGSETARAIGVKGGMLLIFLFLMGQEEKREANSDIFLAEIPPAASQTM